ncbi:hypothetical protein [Chromobacterium sp. IIBBL 290-4]|uniref:hypothetical protein n=1 Tax=Chromobacterium sp. IIBBL 290-4 TaxID=2953890 RepID=UPI0020B81990|nr:hypothetical protein [Chromobacterium sp. IIBBL 290-4]UTH76203.1 hypothetical protein NKT35_08915 [Chromobacterium sp. IIBBL 290-4]
MADAILVQVAPNTQVGKHAVSAINLAILIGIHIAQRIEAIRRQLTIALQRIDAKKLSARINGAVAIAIQHQPAIIGLDPAGACFYSICIMIKQNDLAIPCAGGFNAIAI